MMGDIALCTAVSNFFRSKGISVNVNNSWVQGCIDFFRSENPNANSSSVQAFVYDQWLLADLCDIGEPCLPPSLANLCTVLSGTYALQVNEVLNIGQSSYTQLQQIRKLATENSQVGDKPAVQAWKPKGSRMLRLALSDGVQNIFGMEYGPIKSLQEPFIPGFKIVVQGPVECRKGVLLLQEKHITICGGEVDVLVINNSLENLLLKSLNLPPVEQPCNFISTQIQTNIPEELNYQGFPRALPARNQPNQNQPARNQPNQNQPARNQPNRNQPARNQPPRNPPSNFNRPVNSFRDEPNNQGSNFQNNQTSFDGLLDDDDDLLAMHLDQVVAEENNAPDDSMHLLSDEDDAFLQVDDIILNQQLPESHSNSSTSCKNFDSAQAPISNERSRVNFRSENSRTTDSRFKTSSLGTKSDSKYTFKCNDSISVNTLEKPCSSHKGDEFDPTNVVKKEPLSLSENIECEPSSSKDFNEKLSCKQILKQSSSQIEKKSQCFNASQVKRLPDLPLMKRNASSPLEDDRDCTFASKIVKGSLTASVHSGCSSKNEIENIEQVNFLSSTTVSLSELFAAPFAEFTPKFVEAFVTMLTSKLTITKENTWSLSAKISDGVDLIEVSFSDEVLRKLTGFSATDLAKRREEISSNADLKNQTRQLIAKAKEKVVNLKAKMKIEYPVLNASPIVSEIVED